MNGIKNTVIILLTILTAFFSVSSIYLWKHRTAETAGKPVYQTEGVLDGRIGLPAEHIEADLSAIPGYSGTELYIVNDDIPFFSAGYLTESSYEVYSALDASGRCGFAMSCIGRELMPSEDRKEIGMIKPSGWQTVKYDGIDGGYLYNRCHLIGYQLTGENDNILNLITGTRYLNTEGMLPIENMTAEYIRSTGNHVLYRVTPDFKDGELLCRGVLMEGYSVEDEGDGICFCRYVYNVQPGITINYADGTSEGPEYRGSEKKTEETIAEEKESAEFETDADYILNTNSHRFHYPWCSSVKEMSEHNRKEFYGSREELIEEGYKPCSVCEP